MKLQQILQAMCCIYIFSFYASPLVGSGLLSLSSLEKEEKKIYIIGIDPDVSCEESLTETKPYLELLARLSSAPFKTAFIMFGTKEGLREMGSSTFFTFKIERLIVREAIKNDFTSGSMYYSTYDDDFDPLFHAVQKSNMILTKLDVLLSVGALLLPHHEFKDFEDFLKIDKCKPNPFFINKECFHTVKNKLIKLAKNGHQKNPTIKEYLNLIETYHRKIMDKEKNPLVPLLKEEWISAKEATQRYLKIYTKKRVRFISF
ncbi:hypothetical protein H0X06_02825 [Candidatus Dependentiae bacterium]|nr:hypothetical protein [Candidatus Dependentiae bacterium]